MKKFLGFGALLVAVSSLSACGGIPQCNETLDECNRGGAYTEERTAQADRRVAPPPAPEPIAVPQPAPQPAPAPVVVVEEPEPEPVVDDTPVMTSAEPQFDQVAK